VQSILLVINLPQKRTWNGLKACFADRVTVHMPNLKQVH